jgi:hypothetical protein
MRRSSPGRAGRTGGALKVAVGLVMTATLVVGAWLAAVPGVADAATSGGCGSLPSGTDVYVNCVVPAAAAPYATYSDGQLVDLAMGPNSLFSSHGSGGVSLVAIECEYSTGSGPGDPPDTNYCSAQTAASDFPYAAHTDGSFDYALDKAGDLVSVYALPDATFADATITCNATHPCVWYVGENYNNFTAPHVFSNPFVVTGTATTVTSPPVTTPGGTTPTVPAPPASAQLAYTGVSLFLILLACLGVVLLLLGALGRSVVTRRPEDVT